MDPLRSAARAGPWVLVGGLVLGLALPAGINPLEGHVREMVVLLLFVSVLRVDPVVLVGGLGAIGAVLRMVLLLQLALPLSIAVVGGLAGVAASPVLLAAILATSAPAIVGSPSICAMLGAEPSQSLRLMIAGTLLVPLTIVPVFRAAPQIGDLGTLRAASLGLLATVLLTSFLAGALRRIFLPAPSAVVLTRLDGLAAITLAAFVIGLMPALRQAAVEDPGQVAGWMALAFAINWGAQIATFHVGCRSDRDAAIANAIYAGNRNVALFLVALPPHVTAEMLVFIGCYQFPMYLTPLAARWYLARHPG